MRLLPCKYASSHNSFGVFTPFGTNCKKSGENCNVGLHGCDDYEPIEGCYEVLSKEKTEPYVGYVEMIKKMESSLERYPEV